MKKTRIIWLIKILVGMGLIFFLYQKINQRNEVLSALRKAELQNVLLCFLLFFPNFYIQFLKWRLVLRSRFSGIKDREVIQSLFFGATLGFVTPGNLGELTRALSIKDHDRIIITGLNIIDKFSGIIVFSTMGLISINYIFITKYLWPDFTRVALIVVSLFGVSILLILALNPQWVKFTILRINWKNSLRSLIENICSSLDGISTQYAIKILVYAFLWFLIIVSQYHLLILAFEDCPFFYSLIAVGATLFTKILLPISFADLGIREGAAIFYYSLFGISHLAAFNAALLIFIINFIFPALIGSYFVFKLRWDNKNLTKKVKP